MKMRIASLMVVGVLAFAVCSDGAIFFEVESNDTIAQALGQGPVMTFPAPGESVLIDGEIVTGDVDWFAFVVEGPATLVAAAFDLTGGADAQFQLVTPGGAILEFDDNDGIGTMPALQYDLPTAGTYLLGISGYQDVPTNAGATQLFDGLDARSGQEHEQKFVYKISMSANVIPEPASMALFGLGGLMLLRRRR